MAIIAPRPTTTPLDVERIRADFPILSKHVHGRPVVYLDNAATSQKPRQVIDAMSSVYEEHNANIHRGVYEFSERTTALFEGAREKVARLINAPQTREVIFCRNATEGLNLVMQTWGRDNISAGDLIVTSVLEHHSNFVPWQQLAMQTGARLVVVDVDDEGRIRREAFSAAMAQQPKLVAITHTSNGLGTVTPAKELIAEAHASGAITVLDGAQSVPHAKVDVRDLDTDFLAFSGHKMLAPPGSGVIWGRTALLEKMRPFLYGGDMIMQVGIEKSTWNDLPWKFEAGTSAYVDAIGLGAAVDYLQAVGLDKIHQHELALVAYALPKLQAIDGVRIFGPTTLEDRVGVISFDLAGIHPHDVAQIFDSLGICVRAGHHCNQPLMARLGTPATTRASFYLYSTFAEVDALVAAIGEAKRVFKV